MFSMVKLLFRPRKKMGKALFFVLDHVHPSFLIIVIGLGLYAIHPLAWLVYAVSLALGGIAILLFGR